jgi:hypothetical protein
MILEQTKKAHALRKSLLFAGSPVSVCLGFLKKYFLTFFNKKIIYDNNIFKLEKYLKIFFSFDHWITLAFGCGS